MKYLRLLAAAAALLLLCACGSKYNTTPIKERAEKQAVDWCRSHHGIDVEVIEVKAEVNSPLTPAFSPDPSGGATGRATVTVRYGDEEFQVICDTRSRSSYDTRFAAEIRQAELQFMAERLNLQNLVEYSYTISPAYDRGTKYRDYDGVNIAQLLAKVPVRHQILKCVGDDLSHLKAEDLLGEDAFFNDHERSKRALVVSYRSADYLNAVYIDSELSGRYSTGMPKAALMIAQIAYMERSGDTFTTYFVEHLLEEPWNDGIFIRSSSSTDITVELGQPLDRLSPALTQLSPTFTYRNTGDKQGGIFVYIPAALLEDGETYTRRCAIPRLTEEKLEQGPVILSHDYAYFDYLSAYKTCSPLCQKERLCPDSSPAYASCHDTEPCTQDCVRVSRCDYLVFPLTAGPGEVFTFVVVGEN